jgi:hypothetical protein
LSFWRNFSPTAYRRANSEEAVVEQRVGGEAETSGVCSLAIVFSGFRELESGTSGARELAHHMTSKNLESEFWTLVILDVSLVKPLYSGHSFHRTPWEGPALTSFSLGHLDLDCFFLPRLQRYVHFLPYSRFFL